MFCCDFAGVFDLYSGMQALLGNATNAATYVLGRANTAPAKGYRFPTMAPHEQDYEPSSDHFSVVRQLSDAFSLTQYSNRSASPLFFLPYC